MKLKNIIGFAVGPILMSLLGIVLIPLITWNFSQEDVARISIFQVTVSFLLLFTMLGLDQAYVREYHEVNNTYELFNSCFVPGLLFLTVISIITLPWAGEISSLLYDLNDASFHYVTLISVFISYISRFLSLSLRMEERGIVYSAAEIIPKISQLLFLFSIALVVIDKSFIYMLGASLLSLFTGLVVVVISSGKNIFYLFKYNFDFEKLKPLLKYGVPLVISSLAYWCLTSQGIFILKFNSSLTQLANYSVASNIALIGGLFQAIFSVMWAPVVYKWKSANVDMQKLDYLSMKSVSLVGFIIFFVGSCSWVIDYILPNQYSDVKYILMFSLINPLIYIISEITSIGINISRRTMYSVYAALISALFNLILASFLVSPMGAIGVSMATAISFLLFLIIRTEFSVKLWRNFPRKKIYLEILFIFFVVASIFFLSKHFNINPSFFWMILFPFFALKYFNDWREIFYYIKNKVVFKK
jgi:O-antigen/teichoic acid export membrane protein